MQTMFLCGFAAFTYRFWEHIGGCVNLYVVWESICVAKADDGRRDIL